MPKKSSEICIKARSTSVLLLFKVVVTEHRTVHRAVNPQSLQILRIDRDWMIDDVITLMLILIPILISILPYMIFNFHQALMVPTLIPNMLTLS